MQKTLSEFMDTEKVRLGPLIVSIVRSSQVEVVE